MTPLAPRKQLALMLVAALLLQPSTALAQHSLYLPLITAHRPPAATATPTATSTLRPTRTATPTPTPALCSCYADLYNCAHFSTQAQAQACFEYCISLGRGDIHRLDADNDGIACEWLP